MILLHNMSCVSAPHHCYKHKFGLKRKACRYCVTKDVSFWLPSSICFSRFPWYWLWCSWTWTWTLPSLWHLLLYPAAPDAGGGKVRHSMKKWQTELCGNVCSWSSKWLGWRRQTCSTTNGWKRWVSQKGHVWQRCHRKPARCWHSTTASSKERIGQRWPPACGWLASWPLVWLQMCCYVVALPWPSCWMNPWRTSPWSVAAGRH